MDIVVTDALVFCGGVFLAVNESLKAVSNESVAAISDDKNQVGVGIDFEH